MSKEIIFGLFFYMFVVLFIVIVLPFMGDVWELSPWYKLSPALLGVMTIGVFCYIGYRMGSLRYYIFSAVSLVGVFAVSVMDFATQKRGLEMYFLGMSGVLTITAFALFIHFLRKYPLQSEETPDGV